MLLSDTERLRIYGSAKAVTAVDAYLDALVAAAPPLTAGQKARLQTLMRPSASAIATSAAAAVTPHATPKPRAA